VTEAEARAALRTFVAVGEIERWLAEQRWEAVPGGWTVPGDLHGWRFRLENTPAGVCVILSRDGKGPALWTVPGWSHSG
jgi:hypothetical protein